jgi:hypothetical protein
MGCEEQLVTVLFYSLQILIGEKYYPFACINIKFMLPQVGGLKGV